MNKIIHKLPMLYNKTHDNKIKSCSVYIETINEKVILVTQCGNEDGDKTILYKKIEGVNAFDQALKEANEKHDEKIELEGYTLNRKDLSS